MILFNLVTIYYFYFDKLGFLRIGLDNLDDNLKVRMLIRISFASFLVVKFIISFSLVSIHLLV